MGQGWTLKVYEPLQLHIRRKKNRNEIEDEKKEESEKKREVI